MKFYQEVTGSEQSITNFQISVDNAYSGFILAGGTGDVDTGQGLGDGSTGLLNTGFYFSGSEGYVFDQSGRFVGGYSKNYPVNLSVHMKSDNTFSYFIDDILIANNYSGCSGFDYIEFEKYDASSLLIDHKFL